MLAVVHKTLPLRDRYLPEHCVFLSCIRQQFCLRSGSGGIRIVERTAGDYIAAATQLAVAPASLQRRRRE